MHTRSGTEDLTGDALWTAYLGLGANLPWREGENFHEPEQTLRLAVSTIAQLGTVEAFSTLWRTAPVGPVQDQPDFLNAALRLKTTLAPQALLHELQTIERRFGRIRSPVAKGPRTLDLDILLLEHAGEPVLLDEPELTVPHPEMHGRRFVLGPLAEFAAALHHPILGITVGELLRTLR